MKKTFIKRTWLIIYNFAIFFTLVGFVSTCNIMLFLNVFSRDTGTVFTEETIHYAAVFTFWNATFLAVIFAAVDRIRRLISVDMPVKKILNATNKITNGDFSVQIKPTKILTSMNEFNPIINDLNKMSKELSGIETLRSDFISNVSHELKTPLSALQNYGRLLKEPDISAEKRTEYAKAIVSTTTKLSELVTNILKLNKLENQNIYPNIKKCCLSEQLCECILAFESELENKNLEIETDIEDEVFVETDTELLSIVWNNLISNAIKFTDNGGKIGISLKASGDEVSVCITDTGCGMTAETGKHIFEKFYQGDTSHATHGNGLGLALVKRVIDILEGEINVESVLNKGTKFTVKFKNSMDKPKNP
ncbi:MAG: HAMP domain-containing histidine kinase [Clostridia bacterium]|nr:HAMP domain-containing histidine kinase [Clostridia bacterium]